MEFFSLELCEIFKNASLSQNVSALYGIEKSYAMKILYSIYS